MNHQKYKDVTSEDFQFRSFPSPLAGEKVYVEWDDEYEGWHIFGLDSGHSYAWYASEEEAEADMKKSFPPERIA